MNSDLRSPALNRPSRAIMVVEDSPMELDSILRAFAESGVSNKVHVCRDGEEALQFIAAHPTADDPALPILVLLDLHLPKIDGLDVLHHAREHPAWKRVPIVILSASKNEVDISSAYKLGANVFLNKPVTYDKLLEVVSQLKIDWLGHDTSPIFENAKDVP